MKTIEFTLPIIPKAQQRFKMTTRGKHGIVYKGEIQRKNEDSIISLMNQYRPEIPLQGPVSLTIIAYMPIPKSKSKKWKILASYGVITPITKPDLDNLIKNIKDCMTTLQFWNDDSQVVDIKAQKKYSEFPCWEIKIDELDCKELSPQSYYQKGDLEKFFGCAPGLTDGLSAREYIEKIREE